MSGERTENQQLRLGVFTQDLAQELDPEERAVSLVTSVVRKDFDINVSDEVARCEYLQTNFNSMKTVATSLTTPFSLNKTAALGGLGLSGEKALRQLKDLSGGEKAR